MDYDEITLNLINDWEKGEYVHKCQKKADLQCRIVDALKARDVSDKRGCTGSLSFEAWVEAQPQWVRLCACKNTTIRDAMKLAYSAND